jgi:hypothetical protein
MNWALYASSVMVALGLIAIFYVPKGQSDPGRNIGRGGTIVLGLGFLVFLLGLLLTKSQ